MEVILLEKITNLGDLGDKVSIKPGYARNYLLPQGKAVHATPDKIKEFEARFAALKKASEEKLIAAEARAESLKELKISMSCKAGDGGRLFGSVGVQNIISAISEAGVKVDKHEITIPNRIIRNTGEYPIKINLHPDVGVTIYINVVPKNKNTVQ